MDNILINKASKVLFSTVLFFAFQANASACSCDAKSFCTYLESPAPALVMKGTVIDTVNYSTHNTAVYFQVNDYLRNDYNLSGETIKLYGASNEASCGVDVTRRMSIGVEVYIAIGELQLPQHNPDSLVEDFYEIRLFLCDSRVLRIHNEIVSGFIDVDTIAGEQIIYREYPLAVFEEHLKDGCQFSLQEIANDNCREDTYQIYPNPVVSMDYFRIRRRYSRHPIKEIEIYSSDGKMVYKEEIRSGFLHPYIEFGFLTNGMYLVRIIAEGKIITRKLVVNRG